MADTLLSGKVFVVTCGTQGLGRGIALHLARQGAAAQEISEAGAS